MGRVYCSGRPIHTIRGSFGCLYMRTWTGRLKMSAPGHSAASNASSQGMARISRPSCSLTLELTPPAQRHNMAVQQLTAFSAWARHLSTTPLSSHSLPFTPLSRAARLVKRWVARTFRTAMARARGCPITTTNCFPRVTPV